MSIQLLVTGGPGSGATTTGQKLAEILRIPQLDSDAYFHKPSDPPYQAQYSPKERHNLLHEAIAAQDSWLLSGSIASWGIDDLQFSHAVILNIGPKIRQSRLIARETQRFGARIQAGGDMFDEHQAFLAWAAGYEAGDREGRSLPMERSFVAKHCHSHIEIDQAISIDNIAETIARYLDTT